MDNTTFRKWISWKLGEARKALASGELDKAGADACEKSIKWLESAEKMAKYTAGPAFRRFRKDYERRLSRIGQERVAIYEAEGAAIKDR